MSNQPLAARSNESSNPTPLKMTRVCSVSRSSAFSERAGETALELTAICDLQLSATRRCFWSDARLPGRAARGVRKLEARIYGAWRLVRVTNMGEMAMIFPNQPIGPARRAGGSACILVTRGKNMVPVANEAGRRQAGESTALVDEIGLIEGAERSLGVQASFAAPGGRSPFSNATTSDCRL